MDRLRKWDVGIALLVLGVIVVAVIEAHREAFPGSALFHAKAACSSRVEGLRMSIMLYSAMHDGPLPERFEGLDAYAPRWMRCPVRSRFSKDGADGPVSYWGDYVYLGAGLNIREISDPHTYPILFDKIDNHPDGTHTVLFADWGKRKLTREELEKVLALWGYELSADRDRPPIKRAQGDR